MSTSSTSVTASSTNASSTNASSNPQLDAASAGELVSRLSTQLTTLVRDEMRLAQAEVKEKGKKAGLGAGLFGGAGVVALYGVGALVACAIIALAHAVDDWLAALIVGVVLLIVAGVLALVGKKEVSAAGSPVPQEAVAGIKQDVATVKQSVKR
ncbi:MAG: hypothetical protein QOE60_1091 [Thermoleophilaceae bacterium]|nr:hypothetical protein [Thermoleophilaceae bacterium]